MFDFGHNDELDLVQVWQDFLVAHGLSVGSAGADGVFGTDTKLATMEFQRQADLPATGQVDAETWSAAAARQPPPRIPANLSPALIDWYRVTPLMRRGTSGGSYRARRDHWVEIHPIMLRAFSAAGDREDAIRRMRAYYMQLSPYSFGSAFGIAAAGGTTVHPELGRRLDSALELLNRKGVLQPAMETVSDQGGFSIRRITQGDGLSNHSFGTAIDLSPARNPFIQASPSNPARADFPREEFSFITGRDPFGSDVTDLLSDSRTRSYDDALATVARHTTASKEFVHAFSAIAELAGAFRASLGETESTAVSQEEAIDLLGRGSGTTLQALKTRIADASRWDRIHKMGRKLSALFDARQSALDSQAQTDDPGYIARHGWVNLAPELIAALISKDGARLRWIGAGRTLKDAMHFEIFEDEAAALRAS